MKNLIILTSLFCLLGTSAFAKKEAAQKNVTKQNIAQQAFWKKHHAAINKNRTDKNLPPRKGMPFLSIKEFAKLTPAKQIEYVKLMRHSLVLANKIQAKVYKNKKQKQISSLWWLMGHDAEAHVRNDKAAHDHGPKSNPNLNNAPGVHPEETIKYKNGSVYLSGLKEPFKRCSGDYAIVYGQMCRYKNTCDGGKSKPSLDSRSCNYSGSGLCKGRNQRRCGRLTGLSSHYNANRGENKDACVKASSATMTTQACIKKANELKADRIESSDKAYSYIVNKIQDYQKDVKTINKKTAFKMLIDSLTYHDEEGKDKLAAHSDGYTLDQLRVDPKIEALLFYIASLNDGSNPLGYLGYDGKNSMLRALLALDSPYGATYKNLAQGKRDSVLADYHNGILATDQIFEGAVQHCSRGVAHEMGYFPKAEDKIDGLRVKDLSFQKRDCQALIGNGCLDKNDKGRLCSVTDALAELQTRLTDVSTPAHIIEERGTDAKLPESTETVIVIPQPQALPAQPVAQNNGCSIAELEVDYTGCKFCPEKSCIKEVELRRIKPAVQRTAD